MWKTEQDRSGIFFTQDWASMPGVMPVASGIHIWHMALVEIFYDSCCIGGGTLGHLWVMLLALLPTGLLWKLASSP